ncbi:hypothetical protein, partial [Saccharothrix longispora]|uniref:hypothetical protein n=1 Tax=Saccharothrix longispora TaxID=33920 RepID=UPI0028FD50C8|nr:hypothetical protein [Saccharothrix longispora]
MTGEKDEAEPPAWAVWVARAVAVLVVVPVRLAWEAVHRLVLRPVAASAARVWAFGGKVVRSFRAALGPVGRGVVRVTGAVGRGLRAIGHLVAGAVGRFAVRPVSWAGRWVLVAVLRPVGRRLRAGVGAVGRGLRAAGAVVGRGSRAAAGSVGRGLRAAARVVG